jgi:hypothetical protein
MALSVVMMLRALTAFILVASLWPTTQALHNDDGVSVAAWLQTLVAFLALAIVELALAWWLVYSEPAVVERLNKKAYWIDASFISLTVFLYALTLGGPMGLLVLLFPLAYSLQFMSHRFGDLRMFHMIGSISLLIMVFYFAVRSSLPLGYYLITALVMMYAQLSGERMAKVCDR